MAALERTVILVKLDLVRYLYGAIVSWVDVASDIATCVLYFMNGDYLWFGFCAAFIITPSLFMTISHLIQHSGTRGVFSACKNIFYFIFFGSGILKLRLFTLCIRNLKDVRSSQGYLVLNENDKNDIRSEKVYNFIEALLEDVPQMILQGYVIMVQDRSIHWIQIVSITISLIGLISTLAEFESNVLPGHPLKVYFVIILSYTAFLLTARMLTIVTFLVAHRWYLAIVLSVHFLFCSLCYFLQNRARFPDKDICWIGILLLPCYLFVFIGFKVKDLYLRTFEIKLKRSLLSASSFYAVFAVENILMVTLYYSDKSVRDWYSSGVTASVIMLTLLGVFVNLVFTSSYFKEYNHTRHVLRQQGARRSSRYDHNAHTRFSRRVRVAPEPTEMTDATKPDKQAEKRPSNAFQHLEVTAGCSGDADKNVAD